MRDKHCITRSSRDTVCSFPKGLTSKAGKEDIVGSATRSRYTRAPQITFPGAPASFPRPGPHPAWCPGSAWSPRTGYSERPAAPRGSRTWAPSGWLPPPAAPPPRPAPRRPPAPVRGAPAEPARRCGTPACLQPSRCCRCSRLLPPSRPIAARPPCRDASSTVTPPGHARRPGRKRSPPSRLPRPWYGRRSEPPAGFWEGKDRSLPAFLSDPVVPGVSAAMPAGTWSPCCPDG